MKDPTPIVPVEVLPAKHAQATISPRLRKKLETAPVEVQGTWDSVRRWYAHARYAQEVALFCQVMIGFELIALRESMGEQRGGDRTSKSATLAPLKFTEVATKEAGISERSVWRFISMAEAASTRLKKLPALRGFDPTSGIAALPPAQKEALSTAVRKMTDGLTQTDFLIELGLAKAPQGSGVVGGYKGRKEKGEPPSTEELVEMERTLARKDFNIIARAFRVDGVRFTHLTDDEVLQQNAIIRFYLDHREKWLKTPHGQRNAEALEKAMRG